MDPKHSAVAIIPPSDLNASQTSYEQLGFSVTSVYEAYGYRLLHDSRGASVHLTRVEPGWLDPERNGHGLYYYSEEVEELAARLGCRVETRPWGLREFAIADPDGTLVRVGWPG